MRIAFCIAAVGAACVFACGSSSKGGTGGGDIGSAGDSSGAGKGSGASSAGGHANGDAGAANEAGAGAGGEGGTPIVPVVSVGTPHVAGGLVAGGTVAHSAHFTAVLSLGAAPGGNKIMTSGNYQLRGGVLGASQK